MRKYRIMLNVCAYIDRSCVYFLLFISFASRRRRKWKRADSVVICIYPTHTHTHICIKYIDRSCVHFLLFISFASRRRRRKWKGADSVVIYICVYIYIVCAMMTKSSTKVDSSWHIMFFNHNYRANLIKVDPHHHYQMLNDFGGITFWIIHNSKEYILIFGLFFFDLDLLYIVHYCL